MICVFTRCSFFVAATLFCRCVFTRCCAFGVVALRSALPYVAFVRRLRYVPGAVPIDSVRVAFAVATLPCCLCFRCVTRCWVPRVVAVLPHSRGVRC